MTKAKGAGSRHGEASAPATVQARGEEYLLARKLKDVTPLTGREIGRRLGLADGSGLGNLLQLVNQRLAGSRKMWSLYERLKKKE